MPSAKRVAWAQLKVGVLAGIAMVILGVVVFLITGDKSLFQKRVVVYTYLDDSAALTDGSDVRVNGIHVGKVGRVELTGSSQRLRVVRVHLEVDAGKLSQIPDDSIAGISAANVLGTKYINIKRGSSVNPVRPGGELKSKDVSNFDELFEQGNATLASLRGLLLRIENVVGEVERGGGSIGKLIYDTQLYDNLNGTAAEARKIVAQLNTGKGTISRLFYDDTLHEDFRKTIARMDSLVEGLQQGQGTLGRLLKDPALHEDTRKTIAEFRQVAADLNAGKGSAGKFLKDEAFHKQIAGLITRMDSLIERINRGEGTLGQLVVNPQMYESLNGVTREMRALMKDFRANPKKFLSIKLGLF